MLLQQGRHAIGKPGGGWGLTLGDHGREDGVLNLADAQFGFRGRLRGQQMQTGGR